MKSAQEVFDHVIVFQHKQNAQSLRDGACKYRGDNGLQCAAGCLIPDEDYDPLMDNGAANTSWHDVQDTFPKLKAITSPKGHDLIRKLQAVHDGFKPAYWLNEWRGIANEYKLSTAVLDTLA